MRDILLFFSSWGKCNCVILKLNWHLDSQSYLRRNGFHLLAKKAMCNILVLASRCFMLTIPILALGGTEIHMERTIFPHIHTGGDHSSGGFVPRTYLSGPLTLS